MSSTLTHFITKKEANALRIDALSGGNSGDHFTREVTKRCFCALVTKTQNDRSSCRVCGQKIPKGTRAVAFQFDPLHEDAIWDGDEIIDWGHYAPRDAVIHLTPEECNV